MPRLSRLRLSRLRTRVAVVTLAGLVFAVVANAHARQTTTTPPPTQPPPAPGTPTVPGGDAVTPLSATVPPSDVPALPQAAPQVPPPGLPPVYAPSPVVVASPPAAALPPARPFYKKGWFWGVVGVVVLTGAAILLATSSSGPSTPNTTLGDMRAF